MANKELMITLGLDTSSYSQNVKRAKDLNKELDSSFKMLSNSSEKFEDSIQGLGKKQKYLADKMKVATALTEVYSKRIKESQEALEDAQADTAYYGNEVEKLSKSLKYAEKAVGKNSEIYKELSKELKANIQLYDKSEKAVATHNKRILEASNGYNEVQIAMQRLNKEVSTTSEQMLALKGDEKIDKIKESSKDLKHEFELLKNSTSNFSDSMYGLAKTEEYYSNTLKNTKKILKQYSEEIQRSEKAIDDYGVDVKKLQKEMLTLEESLRGMKSTDAGFESKKAKVEELREGISYLTSTVEFHQKRVGTLKGEYKSTELEIAKMGSTIKQLKVKMKEMEESISFKGAKEEVDQFANVTLDLLKNQLSENKKGFEILKGSVSDFGKTAKDIKIEYDYLVDSLEKSEKIVGELGLQIKDVEKQLNATIGVQKRQVIYIDKLIDGLKDISKGSKAWDEQKAKIEKATEKYEEITKKVGTYKDKLQELSKEQGEVEKQIVSTTGALDANTKKMQAMVEKVTFKPLSNEIKELTNATIDSLERKFESLGEELEEVSVKSKSYEDTLSGLGTKQKNLAKSVDIAKKIFNEYSKELVEIRGNTVKLTKEQSRLEKEIQSNIKALEGMSGEALDKQVEKVEELKREYDNVNKSLKLHKTRLSDVEKGYKSSKKEVNKLNTELQNTEVKMFAIKKQKVFDNLDNKIKAITEYVDVLNSKLKMAESTMKNFSRTKEGLNTKTEIYKETIIKLKQQLELLNTSLDKNGKELIELRESYDQIGRSINITRMEMLKLDKDSPEYREKEIALSRLEKAYDDVGKEVREFQTENNRLQKEVNNTTAQINNLARETNNLNKNFKADSFKRFGDTMSNAGQKISSAGQSLMGMGMVLGGIEGAMVSTGVSFDTAMSKVGALSGATAEQMKLLEESARLMGKTTIYSAKESADAMGYLALAGYSVEETIGALPSVLKLSQAGAMDLATASDKATDSLASLGYSTEEALKEMPTYFNKIAKASTESNTSIEQMMDAYIKVGGQLENLNINLDTSASMLGVLANRGIKAEHAGNSLNSILINMTKAGGESAKAMKKLGVSMFDSKGEIRNVEEVLVDLSKALSGLTEKEQVQLINMIGGKTQAKTLQKLMQGMIDDTGNLSAEYLELKKNIEEAPNMDALNTLASTMSDNLGGDIKLLTSQIQESFLSMFEAVEPELREFVQNITKSIKELTDKFLSLDKDTQMWIIKIGGLLALLPPFLIVFGAMASGIGAFSKAIGKCIDLFPSFNKQVDGAGGHVSGFSGMLGKVQDVFKKLFGYVKKFGGLITTAFGAIAESAVWGKIVGLISTIGGALSTAFGAVFSATGGTVIAVCVAIAGALYLLYKGIKYLSDNWDEICARMSEAWSNSMEWVGEKIDWIKEKWDSLKEKIKEVKDKVVNWVKEIPEKIKIAFDKTVIAIQQLPSKIIKVFEIILDKVVQIMGLMVGTVLGTFAMIAKQVVDTLKSMGKAISGVFTIIKGIFTLDLDTIKEGFVTVFTSMKDFLKNTLKNMWAIISGTFENIGLILGIKLDEMLLNFENWIKATWEGFVAWSIGLKDLFFNWCSETWQGFLKWCIGLKDSFLEWIKVTTLNFIEWCRELKERFFNWCSETWQGFLKWCSDMKTKFLEWINEWVIKLPEKLSEMKKAFFTWTGEVWTNFKNWCSDMKTKLITWLTDWIKNTKEKLAEWAKKFSEKVDEIVGYFKELPSKLYDIGKDMLKSLWNGFKEKMSNFGGWVSESFSNIFKRRSIDVDANINYSDENNPTPASDVSSLNESVLTLNQRGGFGNIGGIFDEIFKDAFSLDNFKTKGGFYNANSVKTQKTSNPNGELINALMQQNQLLMQLLTNNTIEVGLNVDGRQIAKASAKHIAPEIEKINKRKSRLSGVGY